MSNRKEQRKIQEGIEIRERIKKFNNSYGYLVSDAIRYCDHDIRIRLRQIENLFSPYLGEDERHLKIRRFNTPISFARFIEFKKMKSWMVYSRNKEFKKALKEVGSIYERQWFRNLEVFRMLISGAEKYFYELKDNFCLKQLCKQENYIGFQANLFRKRRIAEADELIKELKRIKEILRKDLFVNDIDYYIRAYMDFFVQCRFRLARFVERLDVALNSVGDLANKKLVIKDTDDEKISLELPSWNYFSKFE
ncbi:hypothetical protein [Candidatus Mycoplasma haematohominis]|uniref:Uncharacterized protein n=1 Tax=Candidatus Mycoplasma haematohominis TaxID=1494318 RepID=A0A478FR59_9MOLU|nr:hypothetical protein [Candidatus Mycoplasma haemohominis]GCE63983.1 hypothetical protein MHSWG343_09910 [Candidatus Mycoplasma haemohominis]